MPRSLSIDARARHDKQPNRAQTSRPFFPFYSHRPPRPTTSPTLGNVLSIRRTSSYTTHRLHDVVQKDTGLQLTPFLSSPPLPFPLCRYQKLPKLKATATAFNMLIKMNTVIKDLLMVSMVLGLVSRFVSADDDWTPFEDSYAETEACLAATGHCAETEYDADWENAVACVDAEYRKDPTLKEQCCAYCDALAGCAEGRREREYDNDGYYSTRAKNCKESKMCDSGDDGNGDVITWFDNGIPSGTRATTEPYCDTTGVVVSCNGDLTKVPIFLNQDVTSV